MRLVLSTVEKFALLSTNESMTSLPRLRSNIVSDNFTSLNKFSPENLNLGIPQSAQESRRYS
jgi:hypothetical protein